jgi:hypothetical protein
MVYMVSIIFFLWIFQYIIVDLEQKRGKINELGWFNFQVKKIRQEKIIKLFNDSLKYFIVFRS